MSDRRFSPSSQPEGNTREDDVVKGMMGWCVAVLLEHGGRLPVSEESMRLASRLVEDTFGQLQLRAITSEYGDDAGILRTVVERHELRFLPPADPVRYRTETGPTEAARAYLEWQQAEDEYGPRRWSMPNNNRRRADKNDEQEAKHEANTEERSTTTMESNRRQEVLDLIEKAARAASEAIPEIDYDTLRQSLAAEVDRHAGRSVLADPSPSS